VEKNNYSVDKEKLKEYFPLETVTSGMMEIYQRLLGLKFTKLEGGEVWHDDVSQYQVDDKATGENIGYFYMDLHPRDGKYGHAAMWGLQPVFSSSFKFFKLLFSVFKGSLDRFGNRQKAVATMVCNFPQSTAEKPALLEHRQVQTFFHEFGHVMHGICSRVSYYNEIIILVIIIDCRPTFRLSLEQPQKVTLLKHQARCWKTGSGKRSH
jgi:thimet oligopeptidase